MRCLVVDVLKASAFRSLIYRKRRLGVQKLRFYQLTHRLIVADIKIPPIINEETTACEHLVSFRFRPDVVGIAEQKLS